MGSEMERMKRLASCRGERCHPARRVLRVLERMVGASGRVKGWNRLRASVPRDFRRARGMRKGERL